MSTNLRATSAYRNADGFILDEERLRKINEILITRGKEIDENCRPVYKINRRDNLSYETNDVQQVLTEDNSEWNKIISLTISMIDPGNLLLTLEFHDDTTQLHVEGSDRDKVFLITSDLRQYLSNDVNIKTRSISSIAYIMTYIIVLLAVSWFVIGTPAESNNISNQEKLDAANRAMASNSIEEKINYLINKDIQELEPRVKPDEGSIDLNSYLIGISFVILITLFVFRGFGNTMGFPGLNYTKSNFLLGKEISRDAKRKQVRQNIFWVIIVGFIVSILASVAFTISYSLLEP